MLILVNGTDPELRVKYPKPKAFGKLSPEQAANPTIRRRAMRGYLADHLQWLAQTTKIDGKAKFSRGFPWKPWRTGLYDLLGVPKKLDANRVTAVRDWEDPDLVVMFNLALNNKLGPILKARSAEPLERVPKRKRYQIQGLPDYDSDEAARIAADKALDEAAVAAYKNAASKDIGVSAADGQAEGSEHAEEESDQDENRGPDSEAGADTLCSVFMCPNTLEGPCPLFDVCDCQFFFAQSMQVTTLCTSK